MSEESADAVAWFREKTKRSDRRTPADVALIFGPEALALAASLPPLSPEFQLVRELVRESGASLKDWAAAVKSAREASEEAPSERITRKSVGEAWRDRLRVQPGRDSPRASFANLCTVLEHCYGERLTFNEMASVPHLDRLPMKDGDVSRLRRDLELREDIEFTAGDVREAIAFVAGQKPFHPVREYLRSLRWDGERRIGRLAAEFLGADDELSRRLVARTLIAAVARALVAGCKVDTALVLVGNQGFKKSTFFNTLGGDWYADSAVDIGDRKGVMVLHSAWIYEWPEVERVMARKLNSEIKAFISQQRDTFVPMYGRGSVTLPRSCIIVGSTNEEHFLSDPTGSRRWWIVRVTKKIDTVRLASMRDQLWAEAVALFDEYRRLKLTGVLDDLNPCRWWLNDAEELEREKRADRHMIPSTDDENVGKWLAGEPIRCAACRGSGELGAGMSCNGCRGMGKVTRGELARHPETGQEYVTQADVLAGALAIPAERQQQHAVRIASVLRKLGWLRGDRFRPSGKDGVRIYPYFAPTPPPALEAAPVVVEAVTVADAPLSWECPSGTFCQDRDCPAWHPSPPIP